MNYYELYAIKETPVVDKMTINKKYIELQKKYHPDFFTNENEADQEFAIEQSAHINKAYKVFSNKGSSIAYFLEQKGMITENEKYNLPADFLMEMMELNEGFEENNGIEEEIKKFEIALEDNIAILIDPEYSAKLSEQQLQDLKMYYYKKKYLNRILDRLVD